MTHPHEALTNLPGETAGLDPAVKLESRMEAAERERREKNARLEEARADAEEAGLLWTVQAVLKPGKVFCLVYHGRKDDTTPISSQHVGEPIFGPVYLMGDHRHAMLEAMKLFTVDEITIRTVR